MRGKRKKKDKKKSDDHEKKNKKTDPQSYIIITFPSSAIMTSSSDKRAGLHRGFPNRLQNRTALLLPRSKSLEQLNDLVPSTLSYIVDAYRSHLDIIVEQKVEQSQQSIEFVIVRSLWEITIGNGRTPQTLD